MNDGAYAGLRLAARAGDPDPETAETPPETDDDEPSKGKKKKDTEMTNEEHEAAVAAASDKARAEGKAAGFAEANERSAAVMASEHYAGNEPLAAKLLAKESLSADDIIDSLSAANPKTEGGNASESNEEGDRAEMRKNLAAEQPETTGDEGGSKEIEAKDTSLVDNMKARFESAK